MNITIIGASAGIGLATVTLALKKNHFVTAFSRNTNGIPSHPNLTKVNGNATSISDLKRVIANADAVIVTIGTKQKKGTTLFSDTAKALITAATASGFSGPVLVVTGFGTGNSSNYLSFFMKTVISLFLKDQYKDKTVMEELIGSSALKWEIVRPGMLTDNFKTDNYKVLPDLYTGITINKIARTNVAHFLITQAENPTLLYKYPALSQ